MFKSRGLELLGFICIASSQVTQSQELKIGLVKESTKENDGRSVVLIQMIQISYRTQMMNI